MDWANESYVKTYTRDTGAWLALPYQARCVFYELVRKVDRAGVLKLGRRGLQALPAVLHMPAPFVHVGINALIEEGAVIDSDDRLVIPEHIEAQEKRASDAARQRDSRLRRKEMALAAGATEDEAKAAARPDRYQPESAESQTEAEPTENVDVGHTGHTVGHTGHNDVSWVTPRVTLRVEKSRVEKGIDLSPAEPDRPVGWDSISASQRNVLAKHLTAALRIWDAQDQLRRELGGRTLKPTAERLVRVAARLEAGATEADCEAVLRKYRADASSKPDGAHWFNGETNWRPNNFDRALGMIPEGVRQAAAMDPIAEALARANREEASP